MKIKDAVKRELLINRLNELSADIAAGLLAANLNPDLYEDEEAVLSNIAANIEYVSGSSNARFYGSFALWASEPKADNPGHWMTDLCSSSDTHLLKPIEELYGRMDTYDELQKHDFLDCVRAHITIFDKPGLAAILYNEATLPAHKTLCSFHPYYNSPTLHEFFRLLLEWQWAHYFADNNEHMAVIATRVLEYFGLDVRNESTDPVVSFLMSLPDQQVFQYMKTGDAVQTPDEPLATDEFKMWALRKGIVKGSINSLLTVYEACLQARQIRNSLKALR